MFGLGVGEIVVILVIALLVLGPRKLPDAAQQVAKGLSEFKRASTEFQRTLNEAARLEQEQDTEQQEGSQLESARFPRSEAADTAAHAPPPPKPPEGSVAWSPGEAEPDGKKQPPHDEPIQ